LIGESGEVDLRIIDFGCGIDGIFEHKLYDMVKGREAKGKVYTLAVDVGDVDVGPQSWPKYLTANGRKPVNGLDDSHTTFQCEAIVGDYSSMETYQTKFHLFDAGVLCLSIMAEDALPRALLIASKLIKPDGSIFVVLDMWKFGVYPYQDPEKLLKHLEAWCANFFLQTGFEASARIEGPPRMAYLKIRVIKRNEAKDLEQKLEGVTIKSLELKEDTEPSTPMHEGPSMAAAGPSHESPQSVPPYAISSKRGLSISDAGPSSKVPRSFQADDA